MARIRTIKPDYWEDEKIGRLNFNTRLLYISLFNLADDEGRMRWSPHNIRAHAFRYDDVSLSWVGELMAELARSGRVQVYEYSGETYAVIPKFREHQRISKPTPSKLPSPPPSYGSDGDGAGQTLFEDVPGDPLGNPGLPAWERERERERESSSPTPAPGTASYPPGFEALWTLYPRKTGKGDALKAWLKARKDVSEQTLLDAVARYAADPNLPEPRFVPHLATWLNQKRWDDDALPDREKPKLKAVGSTDWTGVQR